jgi:protein adenylyltransferase
VRLVADGRETNARAKAMRAVNPDFIPRNHRVERALEAAIGHGDFSPFVDLLTILS